jgi:hypothetical protein
MFLIDFLSCPFFYILGCHVFICVIYVYFSVISKVSAHHLIKFIKLIFNFFVQLTEYQFILSNYKRYALLTL